MVKSLLIVESTPSTPRETDAYHRWHELIHIPEMLRVEGFVSARRCRTGGEAFLTIYDIDTDVTTAQANIRAAQAAGRFSEPVAVNREPGPFLRYVSLISEATTTCT